MAEPIYDNLSFIAKQQSRLIFGDHDRWNVLVMQSRWQEGHTCEYSMAMSPGVIYYYSM